MKKLLFVNACIRGEESRTWRIAEPLIEKLRETYDVYTIDVNSLKCRRCGRNSFRKEDRENFRSMCWSMPG